MAFNGSKYIEDDYHIKMQVATQGTLKRMVAL